MNINVIDHTFCGIDATDVKRIATDAMGKLIPDGDGIAINIVMVDAIAINAPPNAPRMRTVGLCDRILGGYAHRYVIYVVCNNEWRLTLYHELYHVFEFVNVITSNEFACDHFAQIMMGGLT